MLNVRRAQAVLKQSTSVSEVYKEQSAKLYTHEWVKKFPTMLEFIRDQLNNSDKQHQSINEETAKWISHIEKGMDYTDEAELQQMRDVAIDAQNQGLNGKYWAFIFFPLSVFRWLLDDA